MSFDPNQMDRTNNYIRNRFLGRNLDPFLEGKKEEEKEELQNNVNSLRDALIQGQKEAKEIIAELIYEAKEIDIVAPAQTQAEDLGKRVQELKGVQQTLNLTLKKNQDTLRTEKELLASLNLHLKNQQANLQRARHAGFPFQGEVYCLGERATSRISGLPPKTSRDTKDPFSLELPKKHTEHR